MAVTAVTSVLSVAQSTDSASKDAKPTSPVVGQMFYEQDTCKFYIYGDNKKWNQNTGKYLLIKACVGNGENSKVIEECTFEETASKVVNTEVIKFDYEQTEKDIKITSSFYTDKKKISGYTIWNVSSSTKISTDVLWSLYADHIAILFMESTSY